MTSNRSSFKMLRETMRRNIWATALSLVGFFFCMPLPAAMMIQNNLSAQNADCSREEVIKYAARDLHMLLSAENPMVKIGICIMAVLCGIALFSYLHSRQKVDFYHSIPMKRGQLFLNNYMAGIVMVLPSYLLMYALTAAIGAALGVHNAIGGAEAVFSIAANSLFFLLIYTISVLATVLTGNTILAVLLDGWMLFSLPAAALIASGLGELFFDHWNGSGLINWILLNMSPVFLYFAVGSDDFNFLGMVSYEKAAQAFPMLLIVLLVTLALAALSYVLFGCRKSERAGTAIAFEGLKLPLKCYMVLVISLGFGLIFQALGGNFWIWFGLLAGTALGHILIEMIYHFDFRAAFAHWKTMIVLAVAAVMIILGAKNDVLGYDTWLPNPEKVEAACFNTGFGNDSIGYQSGLWHFMNEKENGVSDPKSIEAIRKLAEIGIESTPPDGAAYSGEENNIWTYFYVDFYMENGLTQSRSYEIPENDETWALIDSIRFTEEYQTKVNPLFTIEMREGNTQMVPNIKVRTNAESSNDAGKKITDTEKVRKILETLREETLTLTPDVAKSTVPVLRMDIECRYPDDGRYFSGIEYVPVYPTFTRTLSLLAAEGVVPHALTVDDLSHITIWYDGTGDSAAAYDQVMTQQAGGEPFDVTITDKTEMQKLLQNAMLEPVAESCDIAFRVEGGEYHTYTITVSFLDGNSAALYYPEGQFPEELCRAYLSGTQQPAA